MIPKANKNTCGTASIREEQMMSDASRLATPPYRLKAGLRTAFGRAQLCQGRADGNH